MDDALRLPGRAGSVKDEQRVLGVHDRRFAVGGEPVALRRIADVAAGLHRHVGAGAGDDNDGGDIALIERAVDIGLERDVLAAAHALVGGDDAAGVAIGDRPATLSGEKPPNTTEWMAPIRAQASIAAAASGIIGM